MRKNVKILSWLLILVLSLSLVGCSQPAEEEAPTLDVPATEEPAAEEPAAEEPPAEEPAEEPAVEDLAAKVNGYFAEMPDHIYKISQVEFVEKVKAGEDMYILDIRQAADYEAGHVKGALNAPWGSAIAENLVNIPTDKPLFIYCYSGQTAGQAVHTLNVAGFDARSVNLGWNFGISKVEGVEEVTETTVNAFGPAVTEIDAEVQEALTAYYAGLADVKETKYKNYKISEDNLKAMIDNGEDFYLLSMRQAKDYAESHIPGAMNIPWGKGMQESFGSLPMDKTIVVYCYSGQTAGQGTAGLRLLGYDAVSLNGGMGVGSNAPLGWSNKGYETVGISAIKSSVDNYFAEMPDHIYKISQVEFVEKVTAGEDMTILDIRSAADYEAGHVKGAVNAPWGGTAIADALKHLPADKPLYVYCYSGQTAGQAVHTLNVAGFDARSVNLGWNFGISKVEGVDAVTETTVNPLGDVVTEIDPAVQEALTAYYAGLADVKETKFKNYKISEDNLKAMIDNGEDFYLLSIRQEKDYVEGHIQGAENLPWGKGMQEGFSMIPMDKQVVVYCYSGQTAGQATAGLRLLGYNAVSLNGGVGVGANDPLGWTNKGYELVK